MISASSNANQPRRGTDPINRVDPTGLAFIALDADSQGALDALILDPVIGSFIQELNGLDRWIYVQEGGPIAVAGHGAGSDNGDKYGLAADSKLIGWDFDLAQEQPTCPEKPPYTSPLQIIAHELGHVYWRLLPVSGLTGNDFALFFENSQRDPDARRTRHYACPK